MEVLYNLAVRRSWPVKVPYGECWLNGAAMAIICFTYINDRDVWRASYKSALDKFLGDVWDSKLIFCFMLIIHYQNILLGHASHK